MNDFLLIKIPFILFGLFALAESDCGNALRSGSLICSIGTANPRPFRETLCTHATIDVTLKCENEVCSPINTRVLESAVHSLQPNIPVGMYLFFSLSNEDYLTRRSRRVNTVKSIIDFMQARNLSFIQLYEDSWRSEFKNTEQRNYLELIQALADPVHAHGWHIGMTLEVNWDGLFAKYDLLDLVTFVDWFNVPSHNQPLLDNGKLFLKSYYPLAYKNNAKGTVKYFIDFLLRWIPPKCLLIEINLRGIKYVAKLSSVDPGPGSEAEPYFTHVPYKQICQLNIDDGCTEGWDEEAATPFSACGKDYYTYDNATSIPLKVNLMKSYNLTGLTIRSLDIDDDEGVCGKGRFPNLHASQGIRN